MSRRAAILWFAIAALLGIVTWATTPREAVRKASVPLLTNFAPESCRRLRISSPEGWRVVLDRGPLADSWLLSFEGSGGASCPWPVEPGRVQGLLRLVSEFKSEPASAGEMPRAILVEIEQRDQRIVRLGVDPSTMGGSGRVALLDGASRALAFSRIGADFVKTFERAAIESWRLRDLLPWAPDATGGLRIASGTGEIDLSKAGGGWLLERPLMARADAGAVQGIALLLSKSALERFLPIEDAAVAGLSPPERQIVLTTRVAGATPGERGLLEQRIEVGRALESRSRIVRISGAMAGSSAPAWGPMLAVVDDASLASVPEDAGYYLSRQCVEHPAADISGIEILSADKRRVFSRDSSGTFGPVDATLQALLRVLCENRAASCSVSSSAPPVEHALGITLRGPKGEVLSQMMVRASSIPSKTAGTPGTPALEVTGAGIARLIPQENPRDFLAALKDLGAAH